MALRVCFAGFRHPHILHLWKVLADRDDFEVVGACEDHPETRADLEAQSIGVTHGDLAAMLDEVESDVVACGDYYARRGELLIAALEAGRHVIVDKPVCTRLSELDRIEVIAREKSLAVGCMLDLPGAGALITIRRLIAADAIGEVHTVAFTGQHPLNLGSRPGWYFEDGKHGGTINDLAIHAIDLIPWMTGRSFAKVTAGRVWNARVPEFPDFQDGAQVMLELDNGGGVMGDVSYLSPEQCGYPAPMNWRFTVHGDKGCIEAACVDAEVPVYASHAKEIHREPSDPHRPSAALDDFLADVAGNPVADGLTTERIIRSARVALTAQAAAESGSFPCAV